MRIPRKNRTRRLIPRFDLQAYHFESNTATNQFGRVVAGIPLLTAFNASMSSVHSASDQDLQTLPEGLRDKRVVILITDVELTTAVEGDNILGDLIRIPTDSTKTTFKTYWVFKVDKAFNDVIRSNKAYCVEYSPTMLPIDLTTGEYEIAGDGIKQGGAESWWQYWIDPNGG